MGLELCNKCARKKILKEKNFGNNYLIKYNII